MRLTSASPGALGVCGPGRRERKKQQTRDALIAAAFDLFERKGFDATTIEEIADTVDVSARTFFRYFASKEDVALGALNEQYTAIFEALDARPADEPVITAVRHAATGVIREWEAGTHTLDPTRYACLVRALGVSSALSAGSLEQCRTRLGELAGRVAKRMGVDATADPRPTLVASVAMCAVQTAIGEWRDSEPDTRPSALVDRAFALLETGINYPAG